MYDILQPPPTLFCPKMRQCSLELNNIRPFETPTLSTASVRAGLTQETRGIPKQLSDGPRLVGRWASGFSLAYRASVNAAESVVFDIWASRVPVQGYSVLRFWTLCRGYGFRVKEGEGAFRLCKGLS